MKVTFQMLELAIRSNKISLIRRYLKAKPRLIYQSNSEGNTPLHLAAQYGRKAALVAIISHYSWEDLKYHCMLPNALDGDTPLHCAAKCNTADITETLVLALKEDATHISKCVNNDNQIPMQVVLKNPYASHQSSIQDIFLKLLTQEPMLGPVTAPLDHRAILNRYPHIREENYFLYKNMLLAIWVANEVRTLIDSSGTHLSANLLPWNTQVAIRNAIDNERESRKASILVMEKLITHLDLSPKQVEQKLQESELDIVFDSVKKKRMGNCFEYAMAALKIVKKINSSINAEVFKIKNGDHVFLVIGRRPNSRPDDFSTWGPHAMVLDGWSGDVYPASEIPIRLKYYKIITERFNPMWRITGPLNYSYHTLQKYFSIFGKNNTALMPPYGRLMEEKHKRKLAS